jgi:hypothetical protein
MEIVLVAAAAAAALGVMFAGLVVLAGAEGARAEPSASSAGGG